MTGGVRRVFRRGWASGYVPVRFDAVCFGLERDREGLERGESGSVGDSVRRDFSPFGAEG